MDRSTKQKINKETQTLKDTMDQLDLINIYRMFHPKTINFTFFSSAHGTFSRIDHILGHKSSLGKLKKIEIIPVIFSDHSAVRLDLNYRKKIIKNSKIWRVLFLLWLCLFILSGVISLLISSSILGTYHAGEFIFQCPFCLPFHNVHGVLKARILNWFAIPFSRGQHFARALHHDLSILGGPT